MLVVAKGLTDVNLLHRRLGHPAPYTLKIILKACNNFTALNKVEILKFCSACQYGKNHTLHFDSVETKTLAPFRTDMCRFVGSFSYLFYPRI